MADKNKGTDSSVKLKNSEAFYKVKVNFAKRLRKEEAIL